MCANLYWEIVHSVLRTLRAARLKTVLSVLGVSFGVAAVMAVLAIGRGGEVRVQSELNAIGINRAWLYADKDATRGLRVEDGKWLAERLSGAMVAAQSDVYADVSCGSAQASAQVIGCESLLPSMESLDFDSGRFFTQWEEENAQPSAVLDNNLAEALFAGQSPLGRAVLVGGQQCTVVGVVSKNSMFSEDGVVYLPITLYNRWFAARTVEQISVAAQSSDALQPMSIQAVQLLKSRIGAVKVVTLEGETEAADNVLSIFKNVILCVAGVALLVGGIGIMNMMFMSVNERVREIGIRKALGAQQSHILLQFLLEALFLSVGGGIIGIGCGVLLAWAGSGIAGIPLIIPPTAPIVGVGFSMLVGLVFGIAPARRAALLLPVVALRSD